MDYKPYSKMMNFVLTYKCINRECNIETITHQDIDLKNKKTYLKLKAQVI